MLPTAIAARPASLAVAGALATVYAVGQRAGWTAAEVGLSAASVVDGRRPWRALAAQAVHLDAPHLAMNLLALLSLAPDAEGRRGSLLYLHHSFLLATVCGALTTAALAARRAAAPAAPPVAVVGYSGVLFGWVAALAADMGAARVTLLGVSCPALVYPIAVCAAVKVVMPRSSATAHAAGVVAGVLLSAGALDWLTPPLAAVLAAWAAALALYARHAAAVDEGDVEAGRPASPLVPR